MLQRRALQPHPHSMRRGTRVGTHSVLRSGQSTAVGSAASSLQLPASLHECDR